MKKTMGMTFLLLFGLAFCACAAEKPDWEAYRKAKEEQKLLAKEQQATIEAEIKKLEAHPWAGEYTTGAGLSGDVVTIAPDAGFVYLDWADIGSSWYRGTCTYEKGRIKLAYAPIEDEYAAKSVPRELVHVRWGERSYLLSDALVGSPKNFCEFILLGYEPRHGNSSLFLLREGDWEKPAVGLPEFPEGYEKYNEFLREHTIDAKILEVGETAIKKTRYSYNEYSVSVTIDKGEEAGLLPDTKYVCGNVIPHVSLRFSEVGPTQSKGVMEFIRDRRQEDIMKDGKNTLVVPDLRLLMAKEQPQE